MKNVLILSEASIGDSIVSTLPMVKYLKKEGCKVHVHLASDVSWKLMSEVPFIDVITRTSTGYKAGCHHPPSMELTIDDEPKLLIESYDVVYMRDCQYMYERYFNINLNKSLVVKYNCGYYATLYRPEFIFNQLGFKDYDISISIDWYNRFHKNFNLPNNSLLLNTKSNDMARSYYRKIELKERLKNHNFNVIEIDENKDVRENLHLINQVRYILTVDTGVLWLAKSLGKTPYLIIPKHAYFNKLNYERLLGVKALNSLTPKNIVDDFLFLTKNNIPI